MPRGKVSTKNVITEHGGFKLNDPVKLLGVCMPRTVGKITKIYIDKLAGKGFEETAFVVSIVNPDDGNQAQDWLPIYLHELEHAETK